MDTERPKDKSTQNVFFKWKTFIARNYSKVEIEKIFHTFRYTQCNQENLRKTFGVPNSLHKWGTTYLFWGDLLEFSLTNQTNRLKLIHCLLQWVDTTNN